MKFVLLLFTAILLSSCQSETPVDKLSDITDIISRDSSKAQVYETEIYISEGFTVSELLSVLTSTDRSAQTYRAAANDGTTKTKEKLYEYDQIIVISESGLFTKTYSIKYNT